MQKLNRLALVAASTLAATPAFAQATGPDYSPLTEAVDFGTTSAAILSVGGLAIVVTLTVVGIRKIMRMVKGA